MVDPGPTVQAAGIDIELNHHMTPLNVPPNAPMSRARPRTILLKSHVAPAGSSGSQTSKIVATIIGVAVLLSMYKSAEYVGT